MDEVPSVKFSNRLHGFIEKRMGNSLVIKLIGRSIVFNALLNRIQILWKPSLPFQLMDLVNNFYLVRFGDKGDLDRMVTGGGPWVLFGHYLSVQT